MKDEIIFSGRVYIRPCGRGVSIVAGEHDGWHLEDILEENEYYEIELKAKRIKHE